MNDRLLDETEVAKVLGVSIRSVQRWRADPAGPPYTRIGLRRVAYSERALSDWMNRRTFSHRAAELVAQSTQAGANPVAA
jgi:predicted DNA-binding transcriptional regulator AlpA